METLQNLIDAARDLLSANEAGESLVDYLKALEEATDLAEDSLEN